MRIDLNIHLHSCRPKLMLTVQREFDLRIPQRGSSEGGRLVYQLRDDKGATLAVSGTDKRGNTVPLDASKLTVTSSNPEILTAEVVENVVKIQPVGPLGTSQLNVNYDDGDDLTNLTGQLDVEVVAGELASITLAPGDTFDLPPA